MYCLVYIDKSPTHVTARCDEFDITIDAPDLLRGLEKIKEKIIKEGVLLKREGKELPKEPEIPADTDRQFAILQVDFDSALKKDAKLTVKRTISIPEWVDLEIRSRGINSSKLFLDAFLEKYGDDGQQPIGSVSELRRRVDPQILDDFAKEYINELFRGGKKI